MKTAKYQLFYADDSTGSSAHKKGDPVKWTDVPTPKLLKGEKVKEAIIGGNKVNFGDSVVIDIDDEALQAAIGNLSLGKYEWLEVDAGAGYVTDPTRHVFEIKKKDDKTAVVIAEEKTSLEQIINVLLRLDKSLTLPENQGGSGFNGVEFTAFPINGTVAEPVVLKTGINPTSGEDGYAEAKLVFGDWKLQETDGVAGYDNVRDIYIRMTVDEATDKLLIIASFNEDFSDPFNKREFTLSDSSSEKNPNAEGTAGNLDSTNFVASLSTIRFNDNPEKPKEPGIDVEKSNVEIPGAGQGNKQDKPNNVENDADDKETPVIVTPSEPTDIFFKITNTGNEDLTNIQPVDKTTEGSISIEKIKWEFSLDEKGFVLGENGQVLVLKPGESFTGKGTLPALPEGELHGNLITVTATGKTSEKQVEDEDPWYGIDEPEEPGIDIEKGTSSELEAGQGNKQDKPNNVDKDFDDKEAPFAVTSGKPTDIFFKITNTGKEPLSNIKPVDKTTDGSISINEITWDFKLNKEGFIVDEKDELLVLKPGESFTGKGVLPALPKGELHGNLITVEATGTESKKPVTDEDPFMLLIQNQKVPVSM
ncbi:SpaA isopeptide-forming pilin-related protein [Enterococcus termitis]